MKALSTEVIPIFGRFVSMARHGLEFAPAESGDEPAYHGLFSMMRDLYLVVADRDQGTRPRDAEVIGEW
jgi:hypothetical protein